MAVKWGITSGLRRVTRTCQPYLLIFLIFAMVAETQEILLEDACGLDFSKMPLSDRFIYTDSRFPCYYGPFRCGKTFAACFKAIPWCVIRRVMVLTPESRVWASPILRRK